MEVVADFFVDSLVVPFYFYLAAYGIMWILVFFLARLFKSQNPVEQAAKKAWGIGLVLHLLGGTALIVWIAIRAVPRVAEWWHLPFYLIFYVLIVIVDVYCLILMSSQLKKRDNPIASSQPQVKSRNPKKQ